MVEHYVLVGFPLGLSLFYWGLPRTAAWAILGCLAGFAWPEAFYYLCVSVFAFLVAASLLAPYIKGAFDFRGISKIKGVFAVFLAALLCAPRLGPAGALVGLIIPLVLYYLFRLIRFPWVSVYYFPSWYRWIAPSTFLIWLAIYIDEVSRFVRHFA
mgnify:CR=1 FL=1